MFTNHNLPDGLLNDVSSVMKTSNSTYDLPASLVEAAKNAGPEYLQCTSRDQQIDVLVKHYSSISEEFEGDKSTKALVEFERAVLNQLGAVQTTVPITEETAVLSEMDREKAVAIHNKIKATNADKTKSRFEKARTIRAARAERKDASDSSYKAASKSGRGERKDLQGNTGFRSWNAPAKPDAPVWTSKSKDSSAPKTVSPEQKRKLDKDYAKKKSASAAVDRMKSAGGLGNKKNEELEAFIGSLSEEQFDAFLKTLNEDQLNEFNQVYDAVRRKKDQRKSRIDTKNAKKAGGNKKNEEFESYIDSLTEEQFYAFLDTLNEDELDKLNEWFDWVEQNTLSEQNEEEALLTRINEMSDEDFDQLVDKLSEEQLKHLLTVIESSAQNNNEKTKN